MQMPCQQPRLAQVLVAPQAPECFLSTRAMDHNGDIAVAVGPDAQALRAALGVVIPTLGRAATVGEVRAALAIHVGLAPDGLDAQAEHVKDMIKDYLETAPAEAAPAP